MRGKRSQPEARYPGVRAAVDGNTAVILCERESTDAAGAYPITPSTQMGEYWAEAAAAGHQNVSGRPLIFVEPEGEHAAAGVTAGMAMTGLRAANFSSGQGIAYMHESLYAAVGKRLTYVLNVGARAMTKATLNVHAGHDDYHCIDDTGFFQLFARDAQAAADLNVIAHRIAELALNPGAVAQDGFLTTHLIESIRVPERELIEEYLGRPDDVIETPTPAQRMIYGPNRRRVPVLWDVDNPVMAGVVQNQDAYMQSVAAQRPFFFDHIESIADQAFAEYEALTNRRHRRVESYRVDDADYLIVGQGSVVSTAEAVADHLRDTRGVRVGVVNLTMFRPFPGDLLAELLKGRKGVTVLERLDQPLAADLPVVREIRAVLGKCVENGRERGPVRHPGLPGFTRLDDVPPLYSGSFGMGSRDLQPEGVVGAVENMLPDGARKPFFYLSIDFLHDEARTPKQAIHQERIEESYPGVRALAVHGSENPNLMPRDSITARFHSVGGWGAITTGKNLAMTLFDLLGWHIKANPKYGSEKKGQPTTYYLSAAPEPIRINCEYFFVDVVLSPDPNVFQHTNALAGLREGGVFIMQSEHDSAEETWQSIPPTFQRIILDKKIRFFALDAFRIAREEATDPDLQLRMQGIAFQGAFFAASPLMETAKLDEARLLEAIRVQLEEKFGAKGARVVADNLRVVKRGFDEVREIEPRGVTEPKQGGAESPEPQLPAMAEALPQSQAPMTDIHRFWEQTGSFYARGMGSDNITDPFIGLGVIPAGSALFRDMTQIRFSHPEWDPEKCTACGACYTVCPDTAIPGLVNDVDEILETVVRRVRKAGHDVEHLPRAIRWLEQELRARLSEAAPEDPVRALLEDSIDATLRRDDLDVSSRTALDQEFTWFREELGDFQFALSRPFYSVPEKSQPGSGGLLSITVNPNTCKGCMECVEVCDDDALRPVPQTRESVDALRRDWDFWLDLPTTPEKFIRIDDLESGIGILESLLLDKNAYQAFTSGDGACVGCAEKTAVHLFVATVESLMRPRAAEHVEKLAELVTRLERHVQLELVGEIDVSDPQRIGQLVGGVGDGDLTLSEIAGRMDAESGSRAIDPDWLGRMSRLLARLKDLRERYETGTTGRGRATMGMLNATGCTSVWGSTYPFNPYPFPWANHLFQDAPSLAMGVFEGHMARMAEGFRAIREAELELSGKYVPAEHEAFLRNFGWRDFSDEEWALCPPVVAVGGDGAMYDIGFQNLSRLMASGHPIKVLVLDTQVYSNTGGQACTSGFLGQVSDMAQFGAAAPGKQEPRKEIGLIGMAHRTTYVLQSSIAHPGHMIEGFVRGLRARRPALFNIYSSCQPEHGIGDDMSAQQAKLAVESRAYPIFHYDPDAGELPKDCFDLEGNPAPDDDWPTYRLRYKEHGREKSMEIPLTFVDFAITEARFRKHFRMAPRDTWNDRMIPLAEFLELETDAREDLFPFVWSVDRAGELTRLMVDQTMVASCEDRRHFWRMLRSLSGVERPETSREEIEAGVRRQVIEQITQNLFRMADGTGAEAAAIAPAAPAGAEQAGGETPPAADAGMAPWLDTAECTSCDECTDRWPDIFAYDESGKAYIKDARGGPYRDLVKAAERCTAQVIHPGLPLDPSEPDTEKWIRRAEKYN